MGYIDQKEDITYANTHIHIVQLYPPYHCSLSYLFSHIITFWYPDKCTQLYGSVFMYKRQRVVQKVS